MNSEEELLQSGRLRETCSERVIVKCLTCGDSSHSIEDWKGWNNSCPICNGTQSKKQCEKCSFIFDTHVENGNHACGSVQIYQQKGEIAFSEAEAEALAEHSTAEIEVEAEIIPTDEVADGTSYPEIPLPSKGINYWKWTTIILFFVFLGYFFYGHNNDKKMKNQLAEIKNKEINKQSLKDEKLALALNSIAKRPKKTPVKVQENKADKTNDTPKYNLENKTTESKNNTIKQDNIITENNNYTPIKTKVLLPPTKSKKIETQLSYPDKLEKNKKTIIKKHKKILLKIETQANAKNSSQFGSSNIDNKPTTLKKQEKLIVNKARVVKFKIPDVKKIKTSLSIYFGTAEVTVQEFGEFVKATNYKTEVEKGKLSCISMSSVLDVAKLANRAINDINWKHPGFKQEKNHPVVCVTKKDALNYSQWLSKVTDKQYRLPTEKEWIAASAKLKRSNKYWKYSKQSCEHENLNDVSKEANDGDFFATNAKCDDTYKHTSPIKAFKPNKYGIYNILGNVSEWTNDCWDNSRSWDDTSVHDNFINNKSSKEKIDCNFSIVKGGNYNSFASGIGTNLYTKKSIKSAHEWLGFRK